MSIYIQITIFILFTLGYVTYITMWSLFRVRLVGTMELVPHRTHPKSLSFNVRMIARLVHTTHTYMHTYIHTYIHTYSNNSIHTIHTLVINIV